VGADQRGGRHHQGRAARGACQQHGQGLQGLAQAHVIGQAGAQAGGGQAHGPLVAFFLIRAQLRLQRARQHRLGGLRHDQPVNALAEGHVHIHVGAGQGAVQPLGGHRRHLGNGFAARAFGAAGLRDAGQVFEPAAQFFGQGQEAALAQRNEAALLVRAPVQQAVQAGHQLLVDADAAL